MAASTRAARPIASTHSSLNRSPINSSSTAKPKAKSDRSILSFFQKADPSANSLFMSETPSRHDLNCSRFNEDDGPNKRQRLDIQEELDLAKVYDIGGSNPHTKNELEAADHAAPENAHLNPLKTGPIVEYDGRADGNPFVADDGNSSEDDVSGWSKAERSPVLDDDASDTTPDRASNGAEQPTRTPIEVEEVRMPDQTVPIKDEADDPSALLRTETSTGSAMFDDDFGDVDEDDQYPGGEELVERKWLAEQRRLEAVENGADLDDLELDDQLPELQPQASEAMDNRCPICDVGLNGIKPDDATLHVNHCLDGNPIPLPTKKAEKSPSSAPPLKRQGSKIFITGGAAVERRQHIPKPAQAEPNASGQAPKGPGSAFSALMAGHGEEAAFAAAAAANEASRGKPAYTRTCPFYKIMPGFYICVDGFRYGAVADMKAYFLSHFHSDHYVGLTSHWNHGPIYGSKVTCNLVRQQLRVKPEYVVPLDFEVRTEVPGTKGVFVTMISANHCPGSSLFLFEKELIGGPKPRTQRILHCGDFRACPMQATHPLLKPNITNSAGAVIGKQKIDTCYLDTTYLNPKYAFPSQEDVIKACADMCVSLRAEFVDPTDAFETMKRERAGEGMANFVGTEAKYFKSEDGIKSTDEKYALAVNQPATNPDAERKTRGRLLIVVGTYSIGKERICMGIAKALDSLIYAPAGKQRICAALEDPELSARLTTDPLKAQVHMTPLFEIRAETLQEYLDELAPHFSRVVGFRPSGWTYRPPSGRFIDNPPVRTVLEGENWKSRYSMRELVPQRGSTRTASCFGVPYSEHSSFRELTLFVMSLEIEKIVPTVNVGSAKSREKMKKWIDKWKSERVKSGCWDVEKDGW